MRADDRGREGRQADHHHLRLVAEAEPQDSERDPGQRRDRPQEQEDRIDQRLGSSGPTHQEPNRNAESDRHDKAKRYEPQRMEDVDEERRIGVAAPKCLGCCGLNVAWGREAPS